MPGERRESGCATRGMQITRGISIVAHDLRSADRDVAGLNGIKCEMRKDQDKIISQM